MRQAARKLGLPVSTLSNYVVLKKIPAPEAVTTGGITVYLWTDAEIEQVRELLPKIANGRKTRYQKLKEGQARGRGRPRSKKQKRRSPKGRSNKQKKK